MKLSKYILLSVVILVGVVSCKENMIDEEDTGDLMLKVSAVLPKATKAVSSENTGEFPVFIKGNAGTPVVNVSKEFPSVNSIPNGTVVLPVGHYTVSAHSPFELLTQMDKPYFEGVSPLEILKGVTSKATVTCKMKNSKIQLMYTDRFKETFSEWTITIDDGAACVVTFTQNNLTPAPVFCYFGEKGAEKLNVNIVGKTKEGNTIRDRRELTKSQASESYEEDTPNFAGGDGLNINMDISGTPTGHVSIDVSVKIEFMETEDNVDVSVDDKTPENGVEPDRGEGNHPAVDVPALKFPADFAYSLGKDPSQTKPASADAVLQTPLGLKSAKVTIITNNNDFKEVLKGVAFDEPGALLSGAELIGNKAMQTLFEQLNLTDSQGQPKKTPVSGDKEYIFPMSAFFNFLDMFVGVHEFHIALEDLKGNKVEGKLTITIIE